MTRALDPARVAERLQQLRALYRPMRAEEARRRLEELPPRNEPFAVAVARRLRELRALCELTRTLRRAARGRSR
jgi:hypothetical protein